MVENNNVCMDISNTERDFTLVQTVYGVALVLGLENVAKSIFITFIKPLYMNGVLSEFHIYKGIMALTLSLLAVRFFTAANNIRRYVLSHDNSEKITTIAHLPVLLLHAFLFYILCRIEYEMDSIENLWKLFDVFVYLYVALLVINSIWLKALLIGRENKEPEAIWIKNNIISSFFILSVMLFLVLNNVINFILVFIIFFINSFYDLSHAANWYFTRILNWDKKTTLSNQNEKQ